MPGSTPARPNAAIAAMAASGRFVRLSMEGSSGRCEPHCGGGAVPVSMGHWSWRSQAVTRQSGSGSLRWMRLMTASRRCPVVQFAISGLLAMLLVGLIAVAVSRHVGTPQAIDDADDVTRLAGQSIVMPDITDGVLAGAPAAMQRLDRTVRAHVLRDNIVRVKLWTPDGRVIYSDEPRLIGARYPLGEDESDALRGGRVEAEVSDLSRPENRYERSAGKLLEVYLPLRGPNGRP